MIKVILSGCNGKMGKVITKTIFDEETVEIVAGFDINTEKGGGFHVFAEPSDFKGKGDVIIDFSHPSMFEKVLSYAVETKTPVVFATTGLSDEQKQKMLNASKDVAIFFSANMSLGVNLLMDLVSRAAKVLENNFDIEIIEKHHNKKIDAPSGTALAIADTINEALENKKSYIYDRHSVRKQRSKNELGIHALRGGTIVGEHEVIFAGTDEIIEIKHTATSKEVFAVGAVKAAKFLAGKPAGMYDMNDLISQ